MDDFDRGAGNTAGSPSYGAAGRRPVRHLRLK